MDFAGCHQVQEADHGSPIVPAPTLLIHGPSRSAFGMGANGGWCLAFGAPGGDPCQPHSGLRHDGQLAPIEDQPSWTGGYVAGGSQEWSHWMFRYSSTDMGVQQMARVVPSAMNGIPWLEPPAIQDCQLTVGPGGLPGGVTQG